MIQPEEELKALKQQDLLRELSEVESAQAPVISMGGLPYLNFSSNDYLGLSSHQSTLDAFKQGIDNWGAGSGASRLISGTQSPHLSLEKQIAGFKAKASARVFSSGYAASIGVLSGLLGKKDVVILDKLSHASLIDGAKLSGATLRVFPHNNITRLEHLLQKYHAHDGRVIVVTESVFSMDGDLAKLEEIIALKQNYSFLLLLDEAHGVGVISPQGLAHQLGLENEVDLHVGTLGKAVGVSGGYVACSEAFSKLISNKSRSFIYSTSLPAAQCLACSSGLAIITSDEGAALREKLWENIEYFSTLMHFKKLPQSAIIPLIVGEAKEAMALTAKLKQQGILAPAVRFPTVPRSEARLRITLSASHSFEQIEQLAEALKPSN